LHPRRRLLPRWKRIPKKTPDSADIDIEEPQGEEKVEATGLIDSSSEDDEATPKDIERDECKIWDLPVSLAGNIVSYKTSTTAEVAKLREVSRAFGQIIKGQISAKPANHTIKCPSRLDNEKSFLPALQKLGWDADEQRIASGEIFVGFTENDQIIFRGNNISLDRIFVVGLRDEDKDDNVDTKIVNEGADEKEKKLLARNIQDAISSMKDAKSMSELDSICKDATLRGLFEPIRKVEDYDSDGSLIDVESIDYEDYCIRKIMAEVYIPEDSDCIVTTTDTYLELKTTDVSECSQSAHPVHPKSIFIVPIVERKDAGGRRVFHVCLLLEIVFDWDFGGEFESSLGYEALKHDHQNRIGPVEGVAMVDDFLGEDLVQTLTSNIDALRSYQEKQNAIDYHPQSNNIVRDIVHPGLYSYIKGVSELRGSVKDMNPCSLPSCKSDEVKSYNEVENDGYGEGIVDFWGRNEWDKYQWLPTYFDISSEGECKIEHYINGLTPRSCGVNADLHQSLAKLFENALPYINSVYSYTRAIRPLIRENNSDDDEHEREHIEELNITPYSLKGNKVQVITKIVDYELQPGQRHEGVWHVEGMSQEDIVLTVLYILDRDDSISGGDVMFKRAFLADEADNLFWNVGQSRPLALDTEIENGMVPLGKVQTNKGRLIVFPNSHVHKVTTMVNESIMDNSGVDPDVSKRRIVVFFLVNPLRRIASTREVAPQKGGSMTHEDALEHRLELMKVRRYHKQDWNVRDVHLCEH